MGNRFLVLLLVSLFYQVDARADQILGYVQGNGDYVAGGNAAKQRYIAVTDRPNGLGTQLVSIIYIEDENRPANRSMDRLLALPANTHIELYVTCPYPFVARGGNTALSNIPGRASCTLGAFYTRP